MAAPLQHVDVGRLMGSWPILPAVGPGGQSTLLPRVVQAAARIIGMRQETSAGYNVQGKQFYLWVDVSDVPTQFGVSFTGASNLSLDTVIDQINAAVSPQPAVAFRDNGFLRLESPNGGENSYLRLQTDVDAEVFFELGLFAETVAHGGDLVPAATIDPDRQVAMPGQLSWMEGEPFEARVFNRMAFQLGVNADRSDGLLSKKRIAVKDEVQSAYSPTSPDGVQLSGYVYVGDTLTPSVSDLEKLFAVLDGDGREVVEEKIVALSGTGNADFGVDAETGNTFITSTAVTLDPNDPKEDHYVVVTNFTGGAAVLNGKPLKITAYSSPVYGYISPVNPTTGELVDLTGQNARSTTRVEIQTLKCRVSGVYDSAGGSRIEGVAGPKLSLVVPSRVELTNRVVCVGEDFSPVVPGDVVTWVNHGVSNPYSNNGTYRVSRIIDSETLELVSEDWGPVYLNPDILSGSAGTIDITTDGEFWDGPFIQFDPAGGIPATGQQVRIIYGKMTNIRAATDDPSVFFEHGTLYDQEVDASVQRALLAIMGPSATNIDEWVRQDRRVNLESLDLRLNFEHHREDGRHSDIKPDTINMFPGVFGTTVHVRSDVSEWDTAKITLTDFNDINEYFSVYGTGVGFFRVGAVSLNPGFGVNLQTTEDVLGVGTGLPWDAFVAGVGYSFISEMQPTTIWDAHQFTPPANPLTPGYYQYQVSAVDPSGEVSVPSPIVPQTVLSNRAVALQWLEVKGADHYRIFRRIDYGTWSYHDTYIGTLSFEDYSGVSWTITGTPPTYAEAGAAKLSRDASWVGDNLYSGPLSIESNEAAGSLVPLLTLTRIAGDILQGAGWDLEGYGSLRVQTSLGDDLTGDLVEESYEWFTGSAWTLHHRITHDTTYINFRDETAVTRVRINYQIGGIDLYDDSGNLDAKIDTSVGGRLDLLAGGNTGYGIRIQRQYGDYLQLDSTTLGETLLIGMRSGGNFYLDFSSAAPYPLIIDSDTGYVAIGETVIDAGLYNQLSVHADDANSRRCLYLQPYFNTPNYAPLRIGQQYLLPALSDVGDISVQAEDTTGETHYGLYFYRSSTSYNVPWARLDNDKQIAAQALENWNTEWGDYDSGQDQIADPAGYCVDMAFNQNPALNYGFVAVQGGEPFGNGYESPAANEWQDDTTRISLGGASMTVAYGNGRWVAGGAYNGVGYEGWVAYRANENPGGSFTTSLSGETQSWNAICYHPGGGVNCFLAAVTSNAPRFYKTTNGTSWTWQANGSVGYASTDIDSSNGDIHALATCTLGRFYYTHDGTSWSWVSSGTEDWVGVTWDYWGDRYGGSRWILVNAAGDVYVRTPYGSGSTYMATGNTLMGSVGIDDIATGHIDGVPVYVMVGGWSVSEAHIWYSFNLKEWMYVPQNRWLKGMQLKAVEWRIDHFVASGYDAAGGLYPCLIHCDPVGRTHPLNEPA